MNSNMRLLVISWALVSLAVVVFGQREPDTRTIIGETNEVPGAITQLQPVQDSTRVEGKKIDKRSHGYGDPWGGSHGYSYGWPWPWWFHGGGWPYGGFHGHESHVSHGYHGDHGAGWHGGWDVGHGRPWWYGSSHGGGWHGKW